jgi:hypothetical protein
MSRLHIPIALLVTASLSGCLARTALDVVTAPVKVAGKAVDLATTSTSEADEKRGRDLRKREERYGKLSREFARDDARCRDGDRAACNRRDAAQIEMQQLRSTIPPPQD